MQINSPRRGSGARARFMEGAPNEKPKDAVHLIVTVDDTDDTTRATSTGEIANLIAEDMLSLGGYALLDITRHQLLLRDDIPYTSHNSAMAFEMLFDAGLVAEARERAIAIIDENRAPTSDPGLCFAVVPGLEQRDEVVARATEELIAFGWLAKRDYCSIESAYELASRIPWVTLSEHGGTGAGVVGALAGTGLRLSGNDGRFRGKWDFEKLCRDIPEPTVSSVSAHLSRLFRGPVRFISQDGSALAADMPVALVAEGKPLYLQGMLTMMCLVEGGVAQPCSRAALGKAGNEGGLVCACASFVRDNDIEECLDYEVACRNCLYRRWLAEGFSCMLGKEPQERTV